MLLRRKRSRVANNSGCFSRILLTFVEYLRRTKLSCLVKIAHSASKMGNILERIGCKLLPGVATALPTV